MKKQAFPGHKLHVFTSRLAKVQLHGGPPALVNLRISVALSRCQ